MSWDRLSVRGAGQLQDRLVGEQVRHVVGPFSPYWKQRFRELGVQPTGVDGVAALATVPAVGERDVSPDGDPARMAALVVQVTERGFALHSEGPTVRRAMRLRLTDREGYRALVRSETSPTTFMWGGLGFRYLLASTRGDLDAVARAGARMWKVLGLAPTDALVSALPLRQTTEHVALHYAALATGTPALFPGADLADVVTAARLAPPTVLAARSPDAAEIVAAMRGAGAGDRLRTVVLVGAPTEDERAAVTAAVEGTATVLAVHAPSGARLLWAECREAGAGGGLHTYPDLDVVQLVDPETGEPATDGGELVLTQLGLHGSAMLRWRTGDLVGATIERGECSGCHRVVPRVRELRRAPLVLHSDDGRALDLRAVAGALAGRTDVRDWRVVIGPRGRDGRGQVVVHLATDADTATAAVGAASDVQAVAGLLPTQLVASEDGLDAVGGEPLTRRILRRG